MPSISFNPHAITVEPAMFLYMMATFIQYPSLQALYATKICLNKYNSTICNDIQNVTAYNNEENYVQTETSHWILYNNIAFTVPCLIAAMFMGSWSDKLGRKIPILLPPIGVILASSGLILNSVYLEWPVAAMLASPFLSATFGGFTVFLMSVFSYVGHLATEQNRTIRIAILESMLFLGGTVGAAIGGIMKDKLGYIFTFSFVLGTNVVIIIYTVVWITNIKSTNIQLKTTSSKCSYYFNLTHFKESFLCAFKRREGNARMRILLLSLALFVEFICFEGTIDILYLYVTHPPLKWNLTLYGLFSGLNLGLKGLLLITLLPFLKRLFSPHDTTFVIIGFVSKLVGAVLLGLSVNTWMAMLSPVISMLQGWPAACLRAMLSAHVAQDEQGKLFAFVSSGQSLCTLLSSVIFNNMYPATLQTFAGFSFLIGAGMLIIPILISVWVRFDLKHENRYLGFDETQHEPGDDYGSTTNLLDSEERVPEELVDDLI